MILFVIAEVPGPELSLHHSHPSSWGTIFGPNFNTGSQLGCETWAWLWAFREISAPLTGTCLAWFLSQLS